MVRASAPVAVNSGLIPSWVKPMILRLVIMASLLDAQHYRDNVANKLTRLLVVPLGKALSGMPLSCGRQVAGNSKASSLQRFDHFLVIGR